MFGGDDIDGPPERGGKVCVAGVERYSESGRRNAELPVGWANGGEAHQLAEMEGLQNVRLAGRPAGTSFGSSAHQLSISRFFFFRRVKQNEARHAADRQRALLTAEMHGGIWKECALAPASFCSAGGQNGVTKDVRPGRSFLRGRKFSHGPPHRQYVKGNLQLRLLCMAGTVAGRKHLGQRPIYTNPTRLARRSIDPHVRGLLFRVCGLRVAGLGSRLRVRFRRPSLIEQQTLLVEEGLTVVSGALVFAYPNSLCAYGDVFFLLVSFQLIDGA